MTQLTKQTLDAIMADERFHSATKGMSPGLLIAMMITLAMYRKELPGDAAVAAPAAEGRGPSFSNQGPSTDTQSTRDKPDSVVSLGTLFNLASGINTGNHSAAESVLAQFLNGPESESESEFGSDCPVVAQVAALTEQVTTLQDDVKMLVEICRSQQNQLSLLREAVFTNRKVANGN